MGGSTREQLREALRGDMPLTLRDLSQIVRISEAQVAEHLPHVERSARRDGERLVVEPAHCHTCEHVFAERRRFTTPSRCPSCKSERVGAARFRIAD
jgi:hypothetical protein